MFIARMFHTGVLLILPLGQGDIEATLPMQDVPCIGMMSLTVPVWHLKGALLCQSVNKVDLASTGTIQYLMCMEDSFRTSHS